MGFALFLYTPEGKGHLWWELGASSCFETFRIANVRKRMITFEGLSSNANHQPQTASKKIVCNVTFQLKSVGSM
jgi:hypothetical protein